MNHYARFAGLGKFTDGLWVVGVRLVSSLANLEMIDVEPLGVTASQLEQMQRLAVPARAVEEEVQQQDEELFDKHSLEEVVEKEKEVGDEEDEEEEKEDEEE